MVFAVADGAISSSCYSASLIVSFYRTVSCGLDIFNHTRTCISCQNTSTTIIIALHLRIVESDVLDAAISSIAKETNFIRGGADEEITDCLPVAVERSLILLRIVTDRSPVELCYLLFGISLYGIQCSYQFLPHHRQSLRRHLSYLHSRSHGTTPDALPSSV